MPVFRLKEPREDFGYWTHSELAISLESVVIHRPGSCQQLIVHRPPDPPHHSPLRQCFSAKGGFTPTTDTWPVMVVAAWEDGDATGAWGSPGGSAVKSPPAVQEMSAQSLDQKIPWRRAWQPTPVFLPGESHGQRSPADYGPQECKESNTIKAT